MSKFSTVPTWYDKNGRLNQMLTGDARSTTGPENISIGVNSSAGVANGFGGCVVVGYDAHGNGTDATAIGALASAERGSIAIGRSITASGGGIGIGGNASANQIQLGGNSIKYDLAVGDGTGISKIGALSFNEVKPTEITSEGLYWCTAVQSLSGHGTLGCNAFLWIKKVNGTQASAADGTVSFSYGNQGGIADDWAIRVGGIGVDTLSLKCYKVFA